MPRYFLQLPLFKKEANECENQVERWIYLLKNMETLSRFPWAAQSAVFKKLESITNVGAMPRVERLKYDEALKKYRDTISVLEGARMEGYKEGLEIGYKEDTIAIARKMKAYGVAWDMIAEITGLTIDEVKDLE
ncbi:MAG: Rpn family recombination-promoting nuclease/putative transposase [Bacteroidales bacterium]|nr:Rpn family recombination-promoting nuclease/putative transposase [Bacteroidales bacterium]